jgi:hypothetical protein
MIHGGTRRVASLRVELFLPLSGRAGERNAARRGGTTGSTDGKRREEARVIQR